jgi:hypothetical protein
MTSNSGTSHDVVDLLSSSTTNLSSMQELPPVYIEAIVESLPEQHDSATSPENQAHFLPTSMNQSDSYSPPTTKPTPTNDITATIRHAQSKIDSAFAANNEALKSLLDANKILHEAWGDFMARFNDTLK